MLLIWNIVGKYNAYCLGLTRDNRKQKFRNLTMLAILNIKYAHCVPPFDWLKTFSVPWEVFSLPNHKYCINAKSSVSYQNYRSHQNTSLLPKYSDSLQCLISNIVEKLLTILCILIPTKVLNIEIQTIIQNIIKRNVKSEDDVNEQYETFWIF